MKTIADVFEAFEGTAGYAAVLDLPYPTAAAHKNRKSIPVEYWPKLAAEAARLGKGWITIEALAAMAKPRERREPAHRGRRGRAA